MPSNVADTAWYVPDRCTLLARSCIDCGQLLPAQCFWRKGNGRRQECGRCSGRRVNQPSPASAWQIPRTGIPVAKSCADCGRFLPAKRFWRNGKPGRLPVCARCMKRRNYKRKVA